MDKIIFYGTCVNSVYNNHLHYFGFNLKSCIIINQNVLKNCCRKKNIFGFNNVLYNLKYRIILTTELIKNSFRKPTNCYISIYLSSAMSFALKFLKLLI